MKALINIWIKFGYITYWLFWIGSVALFGASMKWGIIIGVIAYLVYLLILQVLYWIVGWNWIWKP